MNVFCFVHTGTSLTAGKTGTAAFCLLLAFGACSLPAETEMRFPEAVRAARTSSVELSHSREVYRVISSELSPLITERIPSLSFSYASTNDYTRGGIYEPEHSFTLGASMQLIDGGRTLLAHRNRNAELCELSSDMERIRRSIAENAAEVFTETIMTKRKLELLEDSYDSAYRYIRIARTGFEQGEMTQEGLARAVYRIRETGFSLRRAELSFRRSLKSFSTVAGIEGAVPAGTISKSYRSQVMSRIRSRPHGLDHFIETALSRSNRSREAELAVERSRIALAEHRRRLFPSATVFSSITFEGPRFPPLDPEVTMGVEISTETGASSFSYSGAAAARRFGGGGYDALSAEFPLYCDSAGRDLLHLRLEREARKREQIRSSLRTEIRDRYEKIRILSGEADLARSQLEIRERSIRSAELLYENGKASLSALIDSTEKRAEAELELCGKLCALFLEEYRLLSACGMEDTAFMLAGRFFGEGVRSGDRHSCRSTTEPVEDRRKPFRGSKSGGKES